jgi:hypothetical protein
MTEMVRVMRAEDYFETYGRNGIGKGMDRMLVRSQLIDAFHKEIFGLVAMRAKKRFEAIPPEGDPEAIRIARNVIKDETKKWLKLCRMFSMYKETSGLLLPSDIALDVEDIPGWRRGGTVAHLGNMAAITDTEEANDGQSEDHH